jgi:hypothetical protein
MDDAKEYRAYAEAVLRLAAKSDDDQYKAAMLKIAQQWLELAELADPAAKKPKRTSSPDHRGR